MENFRTFVAILLEAHIQERLVQIQKNLRKTNADIKWVEPKNIHLTLRFLGNTPVERISSITGALHKSTQTLQPFSISLTHLGAFPSAEHPQIVWVGITHGEEHLTSLAFFLNNNLKDMGFDKEEREFTAHLTLGRSRSPLNRFALSKYLQDHASLPPIMQKVGHIALIKSTLTSKGPIYETLEKINLAE